MRCVQFYQMNLEFNSFEWRVREKWKKKSRARDEEEQALEKAVPRVTEWVNEWAKLINIWNAVNSITMQMIHFILCVCGGGVCCAVCAQICNSSIFFQELNFISDSLQFDYIGLNSIAYLNFHREKKTNTRTHTHQSHKSQWFGIFLVFMHIIVLGRHVCVCLGLSYAFFSPHIFEYGISFSIINFGFIISNGMEWNETKTKIYYERASINNDDKLWFWSLFASPTISSQSHRNIPIKMHYSWNFVLTFFGWC